MGKLTRWRHSGSRLKLSLRSCPLICKRWPCTVRWQLSSLTAAHARLAALAWSRAALWAAPAWATPRTRRLLPHGGYTGAASRWCHMRLRYGYAMATASTRREALLWLLRQPLPVKSLSPGRLFATPWTVAYQAPPSTDFSRQEHWSGVPFPSRRD